MRLKIWSSNYRFRCFFPFFSKKTLYIALGSENSDFQNERMELLHPASLVPVPSGRTLEFKFV